MCQASRQGQWVWRGGGDAAAGAPGAGLRGAPARPLDMMQAAAQVRQLRGSSQWSTLQMLTQKQLSVSGEQLKQPTLLGNRGSSTATVDARAQTRTQHPRSFGHQCSWLMSWQQAN